MAKQAVLIIHGIGNQRPMQTLRSFVRAVWSSDRSVQLDHDQGGGMWSKPYALSQNFELRRLTTAENRAGIKTDFFEFYWAHLMQGTKVAHVLGWAKSLLWRRPASVPPALRLLYFVLWAATLLAFVWLGLAAYHKALGQTQPWWLTWLLGLVVAPVLTMVVTDIVGDAARYLHAAPANIQSRHAIRAAGVEVLRSLHAKGYERIVVVGHSLGTVIAYDMLTHAWPELTAAESPIGGAQLQAVQTLEDMAVQGRSDTDAWHAAQRSLFDLRQAAGLAWRVSDFITLGSPLAPVFGHAIKDVAVKTTRWFGLLSHTLYWQPHGQDTHVDALRRALDLLDNAGTPIP